MLGGQVRGGGYVEKEGERETKIGPGRSCATYLPNEKAVKQMQTFGIKAVLSDGARVRPELGAPILK
jgi:hypothetical protein